MCTHFKVVSGHQNLKWLFKCNDGRFMRYAAALSQCMQYDMDIKYTKGSPNSASALSRVIISDADDTRRIFAVQARKNEFTSIRVIAAEQQRDEMYGEIIAQLHGSTAPIS